MINLTELTRNLTNIDLTKPKAQLIFCEIQREIVNNLTDNELNAFIAGKKCQKFQSSLNELKEKK